MAITLREDQQETFEQLRREIYSTKRVIVQGPTGYGKTIFCGGIIESARRKKKRALFTVPAVDLIDQTVEKFYNHGIRDVGVIQADHEMTDWSQPVQIASVATLMKRNVPPCDVILIDEVHKWFTFYEKLLCDPARVKTPIIGLSATPWTKGLGEYFDKLVIASTTRKLIEQGRLSPFKVYAPTHPDLRGVHTSRGDYVEGELSDRMNTAELTADIVQTWLKLGQNRKTITFAVDRAHAKHLQQRFQGAGVRTEYQDAYTSRAERARIKRQFHNNEIDMVVNVATLIMGVDWDVRCIICARPTKSDMLFVQMMGRGLRTAEGKDHLLILDHSDNHLRLGFVTDIDEAHQGLHQGTTPLHDTGKRRVRLPKECPNCAFLKPPKTAKCPGCGFVCEAHSKIEENEGELKELKTGRARPSMVLGEKPAVYAGLVWYAKEHGFKPGWADHKYKLIFDCWPRGMKFNPPQMPTPELFEWIRRQNANYGRRKSYAKRKERNGNGHANGMTDREQEMIDAVRDRYGSEPPLMTDEDWATPL